MNVPAPPPAAPLSAAENPRLAVAIMALATALFAGTALLAKSLGTEALGAPLHPVQVTFGRFVFAFLAIAGFVLLRGGGPAKAPAPGRPPWGLHLARTLCGWGGVTLMFAAVAAMPLPDATALSFLYPVFTMLLAIPLLGERVGPWRWTAAGIALVGGLILLRPGAGAIQPAALLALGAAAAMGLEGIFIKRLSRRDAPVRILLINNAMGAAIATAAALFFWTPPAAAQWAALVAVGVVMVCGQALFLQALRRADASFVAPMFYLTLGYAALFDLAAFGAMPDAASVTGIAVLVTGAAILGWREGRAKLRA